MQPTRLVVLAGGMGSRLHSKASPKPLVELEGKALARSAPDRRARFEGVIRDATGRRVIGFMSGNQQDPDIMCEVFILAPTDLVDHHELPSVAPGC